LEQRSRPPGPAKKPSEFASFDLPVIFLKLPAGISHRFFTLCRSSLLPDIGRLFGWLLQAGAQNTAGRNLPEHKRIEQTFSSSRRSFEQPSGR
jgi:hypothetical protein